MHYRGKLIGFLVGLWLGNLVGAILGLWLGHLYDVGMRRQRGFGFRRMPGKVEQALFFHTTFAVMGHIAKAAGRVSEQQIRIATLFMDRMQLQGELRREAQESFRQGKDPAYPLEQELASFRRTCRGQMDLLRVFMEIQMQAAFADGALQGDQRSRLLEVAELLGFSRWELEQFLAMAEAELSFGRHRQQSSGQQQTGWTPPPSRDRLQERRCAINDFGCCAGSHACASGHACGHCRTSVDSLPACWSQARFLAIRLILLRTRRAARAMRRGAECGLIRTRSAARHCRRLPWC